MKEKIKEVICYVQQGQPANPYYIKERKKIIVTLLTRKKLGISKHLNDNLNTSGFNSQVRRQRQK